MKLAIITSSRADWGILEPLVWQINSDNFFQFYLLVTGSHPILKKDCMVNENCFLVDMEKTFKIECNLDSDTPIGVSKAMGLAQIGFADIYGIIKPDAVLALGDRFELLASVLSAYVAKIKIFHLHGGETSGNYDNAFRYMISKMASLHFVATEQYKKRLMQEGINEEDVFQVGALGCEGLKPYKGKRKNTLLVIYHPNTLEDEDYDELLQVLCERPEKKFFIMPNADNGGGEISIKIKTFCLRHDSSWTCNLSRDDYLSQLEQCKAIVGNSSSGIIEAPALATPTICAGKRQKGRLGASSIIDCEMRADSIREAFSKLESEVFQQSLNEIDKAYCGESVSEKIISILKERFK